MAWSIVNVVLPDEEAIQGKAAGKRDIVVQILNDGYEPFSTAALSGVGLVVSFRKMTTEPDFRPWPGQYA